MKVEQNSGSRRMGRKALAGRDERKHARHTRHALWTCPHVTVPGTRTQRPLDTAGQLHVWIYSSWDSMYKEQPAQAEARQYPIMEGGGHELPPLAKELLAVDSFWEGGRLSLRCSLSHSSKRPGAAPAGPDGLRKRPVWRLGKGEGVLGGVGSGWSKYIVGNS